MAVAQAVLNDTQRETLCDTFAPSITSATHDDVEREFFARPASALLIPAQIEGLMADVMTPDEIAAFAGLLDALAAEGSAAPTSTAVRNSSTGSARRNATHEKLLAACDELGYEHRPIWRNASLDDDAEFCGHCLLGCQRSAMKTWLQDASDGGARAVVGCHADTIEAQDGRATGVRATVTHADGSTTALHVQAPTVVVACGSIESPALLLRSGIGGPAAGKHLRLHPAFAVLGIYDELVEGWKGQVQSALSDHFFDIEDGCGFLIEATAMFPAFISPAFPWVSGEQHKQLMRLFPWIAPSITVARDHGSGEVVLDDLSRPAGRPLGLRRRRRRAAGRARPRRAGAPAPCGRSGADLHRPFRGSPLAAGRGFRRVRVGVEPASYAAMDVVCFTAHQMGSCRMGSDPETSVADGRGELHDIKGVWIGDASAFPTAPGVNPMVTIMSLAHRTAGAIVAAG